MSPKRHLIQKKPFQMDIVIFGATGFTGRAVLQEALGQGHKVTVLVRDASRVDTAHENLRIVKGDALDGKSVSDALTGCQAAIQCLGVGGKGDGKPTTFVSDSTRIIVEEMEKLKMDRLIAMSNVGAGDSIGFVPGFFTKFILPYFMKWLQVIIDDKNRMEAVIMKSRLDWTIVRCPNIVDKPAKGNCRPSLDGKGLKLSVTLPDLAEFIVGQLTDDSFSRKAPCVSN
jgi:putative NADH-flavin reductase